MRSAIGLVLVLVPSVGGGDGAVDSLVAEVRRARSGVQAVDAAFEQDKEMAVFAETMRSRGRLRVLGADRLRWDTEAPDRSSFVYDRGSVVFRGPDGRVEALGATGLFGAVLGDLGAFLGGDLGGLARRWRLAAEAGVDGAATLIAMPTDAALRRRVREVRVEFARDRRVVRSLVLAEPNGDRSVVRFARWSVGARIAAQDFRIGQ